MRTRTGLCYPRVFGTFDSTISERKRKRAVGDTAPAAREEVVPGRCTRPRVRAKEPDLFDALPDDLVLCILSKLSAAASCPSDLISVLLT